MTAESTSNPYAPPQTERFGSEVEENSLLQARFVVNKYWQRKIAYDLIMPGGLLLTSSMLVLIVCIALGGILIPIDWPGMRNLRYLAGAGAVGFPIGAIAAIVYHIAAHAWLQRNNLRRLRAHPVLGALGEWLIEVDTSELRIQTASGLTAFPLVDIWWHPVRGSVALVQAPGPLPIGIPKNSDLEPPRSGDFARLLRLRVRRMPFT